MTYNKITAEWSSVKGNIVTNNLLKSALKAPFTIVSLFFLFMSFAVINFGGCCAYSFTGASVPTHIKSIAIPTADDRSGAGEPGLGELLTNTLTQKFIDDNTLQVANKSNADAELECTITSLTDAPEVVAAGENVTSRRVTITVQVVYRDLVKRKVIFNKSFSNYGDYASGGSIQDRTNAIEAAIDNISDDILLDTVSGW
jgi:Lipopolysaccharide-assembly